MNEEQFQKAIEIKDQIEIAEKELCWWRDVIITPEKMVRSPFGKPTIPQELFSNFRCSVMDNMKLRLIRLKEMFAEV